MYGYENVQLENVEESDCLASRETLFNVRASI